MATIHPNDKSGIEQKPPIINPDDYDGDVIIPDKAMQAALDRRWKHDYAEKLAFMEEPVIIRLEPSTAENASKYYEVWVNGQGAEILINDQWRSITWLPVGEEITIKRKVLEVIIRAKVDRIHTEIRERDSDRPNNVIQRFTSAVHSFSIIEDRNPLGPAWVQEMRRRNW